MTAAVAFDAATSTWTLTTPSTSYAFRLSEGSLWHVHWGPRLAPEQLAGLPLRPRTHGDVLGEELPGEGGERFGPPSLRVAFADGVRAVEWRYVDHAVDGGHLTVRLADRHYPLEVELHCRVHGDTDVVERWSVLRHTGDAGPILVEIADSASWTLPARPDYRLSYVAGEWSAEFQLQRAPLPPGGETVLTSRRGIARHQSNPWLTVDSGEATEEHGETWTVALAWSGTFRVAARRTLAGHVTVSGGEGHEGAPRTLAPGARWENPVFAGLYAVDGFGGASRRWHEYARGHVLPAPDEVRPVLYNSWEGTWFDVNEDNQREIAALAADMGVELFVMDDGWFGGRTSDRAGLGDWWPNPDRFPNGLTPLIDEVHKLGMRFGIWVEPEMVNPDSDLYRAHPDWVLHMPNRARTEVRNQLVLDFGRSEVAEWAYGWLDQLLADHEIDFIKWDMNRSFTETPPEAFAAHTEAVYSIMDRLRAAHPRLRIESCASGGGRVDLGIMARTDQVWTSDNTDPVDRIHIQHGYGQVYPAQAMGAWASEAVNPLTRRLAPVRFRFHVAMAGALGVSGNLREWPLAERQEAAVLVAQYKEVRHVVQHGALYRLTPPTVEGTTVVQYVSADRTEAVVFVWRPVARHGQATPPVRLAGLDPSARYQDASTGTVHEGAVLMAYGLEPTLPAGDHASTMIHLRAG